MKKYILSGFLVAAVVCSLTASAQPGRHERRYDDRYYVRYTPPRHYPYYASNYYYPRRTSVSIIASLPFGAVALSFGNRYYHYYDGYYYQPYGTGYTIVEPPVGIVVPALPPGSVSVVIASRPYYRFQNVFYIPIGTNQYQVVERPAEVETTPTTTTPAQAPTKSSPATGDYQKVVLEGKTYYKKGDKFYKASVNENGEVTYDEVGEAGK